MNIAPASVAFPCRKGLDFSAAFATFSIGVCLGKRSLERRAISASFVEEALESLRRRGLPTQGVLAAAGLPPTVVEPVSVAAYGRMWLALAETLDDEFFGLTARPMRPGGFTLLCHCLLHAANLETALRRARAFSIWCSRSRAANSLCATGLRVSNCMRADRRVPLSPIGPTGSSCTG
jgi:hypothetical protein